MARKPALTLENLAQLGAEKLAALVWDEAEKNAPFKRRLDAALAGQAGPAAVAKAIERRLAGLERARGFVDWDKARSFREDLQALLDSIVKEIGPADPTLATDRLLRFIATHEAAFERVDDSSGRVQGVFQEALAALPPLLASSPDSAADALPARVMTLLGRSGYGYLAQVAAMLTKRLSPAALTRWDAELTAEISRREAEDARKATSSGGWVLSSARELREIRQSIAEAQGDLDGFIRLEMEKPERSRDVLEIAERLDRADRTEKALVWVRKAQPSPRGFLLMGFPDEAEAPGFLDPALRQASLEARILTRLGRIEEARALRWTRFTETLDADLLREHLKSLPEFEDVEAEDAAMVLAMAHEEPMRALSFFLAWPRRDLAARLIIERRAHWDGRDWMRLPKIAGFLEPEHPLASTVLYRVLLEVILKQANSKAYPHGARYLRQMGLIAAEVEADPRLPTDFLPHEAYLADLKKAHARKLGFWAAFEEAQAPRGRR